MRSKRVEAIESVRAAIEAVEARGGLARGDLSPEGEEGGKVGEVALEPVRTGWDPVDAAGGLARGAVHEWLAGTSSFPPFPPPPSHLMEGLPMGIAIHLARCALQPAGGGAWIGRRCWPSARALVAGDHALLERSLLVDAPDRASRVWAIDLALRSQSVSAVVADGSGLDMASTRRLQLAARSSGGFCLLLRPGWEGKALSAAQTRWVVEPAPTDGRRARWMIELVRRKGAASVPAGAGGAPGVLRLLLEWDHEAGAVVVAPEVVDGGVAQESGRLQRAAMHQGAA